MDAYEVGSKRQRMRDGDPYFGSSRHGSYGHGGSPGLFPVVRLRGLPFNCSESDVYEFFANLDLVDVLLVHKKGRFSGDAYVVFATPMQVELALQRNRQNMGRRYIEVFRCKKQEYYHAIAAGLQDEKSHDDDDGGGGRRQRKRSAPPAAKVTPEKDDDNDDNDNVEHTGVLRLRGLPFSVSKHDIIEFFNDFGVVEEDNVHILTMPDGRATGEAFVQFSGPAEAQSAMKKDKMVLGTRYVELFPSSREEATRAAAKSRR